jgi:hypothetical protein
MRRFLPLLVGVLLLALVLPGAASAKQANYSTPISGWTNTVGQTFTGTLDISKVAVRNGQLVALGTVTGAVTDLAGTTIQTVNTSVALPITVNAATCNILDLTLGPLDLNLLGLVIHLNQVHLVIDAQAGPGNLLGNLLCAIAGLLDGGGPLGQIANLLNQILAILQGLGL